MGRPGSINRAKLAKAIEVCGIPKRQLADKMGCGRMTIENILKGRDPYISTASALAYGLGVSVGFLLDEESQKELMPGMTVSERTSLEIPESWHPLTLDEEAFYQKMIATLRKRIDDKEKMINILSESIDELQLQLESLEAEEG